MYVLQTELTADFAQAKDNPGSMVLNPQRTYKNTLTGNTITTELLKEDRYGNRWWTFQDLYTLPLIRQMATAKISRLFGSDLLLEDVLTISKEGKDLCKSTAQDKYERIYSKWLELESLASAMADPVKQYIALCTVYLMLNDEGPDQYSQAQQNKKMELLALDLELQTFFLTWWSEVMSRYGKDYKGLTPIVSNMIQKSTGEPLY